MMNVECAECHIDFLISEDEMEDENFCFQCGEEIYAGYDLMMDEIFFHFVEALESLEKTQK